MRRVSERDEYFLCTENISNNDISPSTPYSQLGKRRFSDYEVGMKLGTVLYTLFMGRFAGADHFGNRYYERRNGRYNRPQRWVIYRGLAEPSKVPAEWHGWLHNMVKIPPSDSAKPHRWQKPHMPNLTGSSDAYYPKGHILSGGKRDKATGDYEAWRP